MISVFILVFFEFRGGAFRAVALRLYRNQGHLILIGQARPANSAPVQGP